MVAPMWRTYNHRLTGATRVRMGWRGRLVLQVEEQFQAFQWQAREHLDPLRTRWRDARITDINGTAPLTFK